jgi:hypothetical protein
MKSLIRRKWQTFLHLGLPLLQKSGIISDNLTVSGKVENALRSSNIEIQSQNMVGRKGLILFFMWIHNCQTINFLI